MNRIDQKFKDLAVQRKKAFIAFLTAGDPSLKLTEELVCGFEKAGVDIVEIGVPFSDPLADGPTIQAASQRSLNKHTNLTKILSLVKRIRTKTDLPITLMTYYNPVFHYGEKKFVLDAKDAGVDGLIIPDLPPEEAAGLIKEAKRHDVSTVFFLAPTTTLKRAKSIVQASTGFIYYVSLTGVTGTGKASSLDYTKHLKQMKRLTKKPICIGFGVSTAAQVKKAAQQADGVIVGSAIVSKLNGTKSAEKTLRFVKGLTKELK